MEELDTKLLGLHRKERDSRMEELKDKSKKLKIKLKKAEKELDVAFS